MILVFAVMLLTALPDAQHKLPATFCVQGMVQGNETVVMTMGRRGAWGERVTAGLTMKTASISLPIVGLHQRGALHLTFPGEPKTTPWPWAVADYPHGRHLIGQHVRACGRRGAVEPFRYYVLDVERIDVLEEVLP